MLEWAAAQGGSASVALLQSVLGRVISDAQEARKFLDEVCGVGASRALRRRVRRWLELPATCHLLASEDPVLAAAASVTLADALRGLPDAPDARTLVSAARAALARREPATPAVRKLDGTVREAAAQQAASLEAILEDTTHIRGTLAGGALPSAVAPLDPAREGVERLRAHYRAAFAGQEQSLEFLDGFLTDRSAQHALLLQETGRGKTALLVRWVDMLLERGDAAVVFVPIHRHLVLRDASVSPARVVFGSLLVQLAACHGEPVQQSDLDPEQARMLIGGLLRRDAPAGGRLLVVVDGLDEAVGFGLGSDVLPARLGDGVKVVVSARHMAGVRRHDWLHSLGWEEVPVAEVPTLQPLRDVQVADVVAQLWAARGRQPTGTEVAAVVKVSEGDPLMVRWVANDLLTGAETVDRLSDRPTGLRAYFMDALRRDELGASAAARPAVRALLGCCAAASGPVSADDLAGLMPEQLGERAVVNDAARAVGRFLVGDGSAAAGFVFNYPRLGELYWDEQLNSRERAELVERFVGYGQQWWDDRSRPLPGYVRNYWPAHLASAGRWALLREALTRYDTIDGRKRQPWAAARYRAEGSYSGYVTDLDLLWRHSEEHDDLATGFACAVITASIHSLAGNLPPALIAGLVVHGTRQGRWSIAAALEHIRRIPDPHKQADALRTLHEACGDRPWPWELTLDVARTITGEGLRAEVLAALAPALPEGERSGVLDEALTAARRITDEWLQAEALVALAPAVAALPEGERSGVLAEALRAARTIADVSPRARVFAALAPALEVEWHQRLWNETLRALAARRRSELLSDVAALCPWLTALASPTDLRRIASAIHDTTDAAW
jgi:hypothetical protein